MQLILNKFGECGGCLYFNRQYDHELCRYCERNPNIAKVLRDNKTKQDKELFPEKALEPEPGSPLATLTEANRREAAAAGVNPDAIDRMVREHDARRDPKIRKR